MRLRVLVVDDEPSILFAMKDYLEAVGYQVDCAPTSDVALSLLGTARYAVLIADLRLSPRHPSDGLDLLAHARRRCPGIRTVLLTAHSSVETEWDVQRLGVDRLLHKPQEMSAIREVVDGLAEP
jgi:DNA-binding response OmpR family regulator